MLKRAITDRLIEWKNREGHHPLIVKGLRQTGKTFTVKKFGEDNYKSVIYIDLRADQSIHKVFDGDFDVNQMILSITAAYRTATFIPGETLLILDEIQDCPNARSSLKYWDIDGRFDVIATGSFLGIRGLRKAYVRGIPVGYEEQLEMHPLSFAEFLENIELDRSVVDHVSDSIRECTPVLDAVHDNVRKYYLQYLVVGGMPEAVNTFIATHDLNRVRRIQQGILTSMGDDFGRYVDSNGQIKINEVLKLRAEACLKSLPTQLSKEYKKFQYSLVNVKGHSAEKADGLQYLVDMGIVLKAYNVRELSCPLEGQMIYTEFKVFMADTGLLMSMLGHDAMELILNGDMGAYKGAVAENMVACSFAAGEMPLYYFHAPSGSPELDFVFERKGGVTIIECKSTNNRPTSMKYVLEHPNKYGMHSAIKIADGNVGNTGKFVTYPLYALGFVISNDRH